MDVETTAQALVPETTVATEDAALDAAFDRAMASDTPEDPAPEPVETETSEDAPEPTLDEAAQIDVPTDLPVELRKHWAGMAQDARDAWTGAHRDLTRKLSEQGRMMQGISPIRDVLTQAVRDLPQLAGMTPAEVATDVMHLARTNAAFKQNPVGTLVGLIQEHNLGPQIAKALGSPVAAGAEDSAALRQQIAAMQQQMQSMADPNRIHETVETALRQRAAMDDLTKFSATAEHWAAVENHMPKVIPLVQEQLGPDASPSDVLARAYELARSIYLPAPKATAQAAVTSPPAPNPAKAAEVLKATSVNVKSSPSGNTRDMTEDELLDATYERLHRRK